ncbi:MULTISPECIES: tripartite tricarboxylate transporter TctB family protein [unclassified Paenibacillus]|uniref:tripartite tricarboxylate transporter TctB family protein n=1 Tax=unclassified Paenibacillus TaxID=185978 RepID=UPI001AE15821|nr:MULTISPECIES: tripartite tricarboxylate transporter TctB family protein [unclassified Paenibacillus]MBP1155845.1 putative membrane protein [Paenibacillus sp. PvP091]MBP1168769.1 putative membrane protein [Paenibacillus sp. PvR098]MBP2439797.1 putative membrane protein [Paenibacillus sp. PvP052]
MSYKIASYVSLIFFAMIGVLFFSSSFYLPASGQTIGPEYFPRLLSIILIIFCIISFITTTKKKDVKVEFANPRYIIFTVLLSIVFIGLWHMFGLFYVFAFVYMAILFYFYNQDKHSLKKAFKYIVIALGMAIFLYVLFERLLNFTIR